ncbi:MAG: hypothetical protein AB1486_15345 [Planctomycetota bacterium]
MRSKQKRHAHAEQFLIKMAASVGHRSQSPGGHSAGAHSAGARRPGREPRAVHDAARSLADYLSTKLSEGDLDTVLDVFENALTAADHLEEGAADSHVLQAQREATVGPEPYGSPLQGPEPARPVSRRRDEVEERVRVFGCDPYFWG